MLLILPFPPQKERDGRDSRPLSEVSEMVKKCINPIRIQWGLWRSSGRNEEALGAPEVPFVLGEGTGDFPPLRFEFEGGWQSWQGLRQGGSAAHCIPLGSAAAYQAMPAAGSGDFKGVSKAKSTLFVFRHLGRD